MAQLKQEKSVGEIERLQNEIRKKSETVMTSLFNELELPFESGTKPQDMFKTIFANHEEEVKELKGELAKANKLIEKMQQSAADGNRDIIEERDALVAERDELRRRSRVRPRRKRLQKEMLLRCAKRSRMCTQRQRLKHVVRWRKAEQKLQSLRMLNACCRELSQIWSRGSRAFKRSCRRVQSN